MFKKMQMIYSVFIVIFKASMYCQKTFIIVYLILKNKLKTNQNENLFAFAQERLGVVSKQKDIYRYRPKLVEKYRHIGKIQYRASLIYIYILYLV